METDTATLQDGSAGGGQVKLADGQVVEYDWLVLALGSETSTFGIEGVKELAVPFCSFDDAMKVGGSLSCRTDHCHQLLLKCEGHVLQAHWRSWHSRHTQLLGRAKEMEPALVAARLPGRPTQMH